MPLASMKFAHRVLNQKFALDASTLGGCFDPVYPPSSALSPSQFKGAGPNNGCVMSAQSYWTLCARLTPSHEMP
jgi:hypothetical protein